METDVAVLSALKGQVVARLQELTIPPEEDGTHVERVRLSEFFTRVLDTDAAVNDVVERLREHLLKLVAEGKIELKPFLERHPMSRLNDLLREGGHARRPVLIPDFEA